MDSSILGTQISNGFSLHRQGRSSPISTTSLNHVRISEALLKSEDNGATLDFSHKGLTDVGEYGAEELATIGREDSMEDESSVLRCAIACSSLTYIPLFDYQDHISIKPSCHSSYGFCIAITPSLPQPKKQ